MSTGRVAQMNFPVMAALLRSAGHTFSQGIWRFAEAAGRQGRMGMNIKRCDWRCVFFGECFS
jgi:hypothetical protein